ncbi:MAG: aldo/keto reductase [Actinomycetota bacterium]
MSIDPSAVPTQELADGTRIPAIGLGTFGSDHIAPSRVATAVGHAISFGYRHVDTASVYGNEADIGAVLNRQLRRGVARDDLWISSKLWNDSHDPAQVARACETSLRDLGLEHLDAYLVHWPFSNHHRVGATVHDRATDARPFSPDRYLATWQAMESLVDRGLVRHIGTSNMTQPKFDAVLEQMRIRPAVNQMEIHPHHQQPALVRFLTAERIVPIGFCPIGSPARPARDRTPDDSSPTDDPVVVEIATRHGLHPATLCVAWACQRGHIPIPFSTTPANIEANLRAACSVTLDEAEMTAIASADQNCRLIKGQVFLWRDGQDWRDLWDVDGVIAC